MGRTMMCGLWPLRAMNRFVSLIEGRAPFGPEEERVDTDNLSLVLGGTHSRSAKQVSARTGMSEHSFVHLKHRVCIPIINPFILDEAEDAITPVNITVGE